MRTACRRGDRWIAAVAVAAPEPKPWDPHRNESPRPWAHQRLDTVEEAQLLAGRPLAVDQVLELRRARHAALHEGIRHEGAHEGTGR